MELFMDLGASVTFVAEQPEEDVMSLRPRDPRRPFMDGGMQFGIVLGGFSLGAAVLVGYLTAWAHGSDLVQAQTAAFGAWMIGHVVLAAHMRAERQPLLRTNPFANRPFLVWAAAAVGLLIVGMTMPGLRGRLHVATLEPSVWAFVLAAALILPSWWEPWKWLRRRTARRRDASGASPLSSRVN
jgi:Ca2+-transporting ATPase